MESTKLESDDESEMSPVKMKKFGVVVFFSF